MLTPLRLQNSTAIVLLLNDMLRLDKGSDVEVQPYEFSIVMKWHKTLQDDALYHQRINPFPRLAARLVVLQNPSHRHILDATGSRCRLENFDASPLVFHWKPRHVNHLCVARALLPRTQQHHVH